MQTNHLFPSGCLLGMIASLLIILAQVCCATAGEAGDKILHHPFYHHDVKSGAIDGPIAYAGLIQADATRLTDQQLNLIRGGMAGLHFGISFAGIFDKLGNLTGRIFSGNENVPEELVEAVFTQSSASEKKTMDNHRINEVAEMQRADVDGASISAYVGNFDGASGIFQITQSPGSYNVVTNNMTINISVYNFASESQASSILPRLLNGQ